MIVLGGGRDDVGALAPPRNGFTHHRQFFGLLLSAAEFHALADRLRAAGTGLLIEPYLRFPGRPGEQWTMFFRDPAGNALEFKAFRDESQVFAR